MGTVFGSVFSKALMSFEYIEEPDDGPTRLRRFTTQSIARKYVVIVSSFGGSACLAEIASGWSEVECE